MSATADKVKLIKQWEADYIRERIVERLGSMRKPLDLRERDRVGGAGGNVADCGTLEIIDGTGRAVCRCCGGKIAKGALALKFPYDFTGSGSWSAVDIQIHGDACQSPND